MTLASHSLRISIATATLATLAPFPALASATDATPPPNKSPGAPAGHRSPHATTDANDDGDTIVVSGHLPIDFGLLAGSESLEGDALTARMRSQIGETLARLPGVSATSFAPGASRPVLRGFDGDRVRVLVDGIGSIDASAVSADHAVVLDALTVDHIDIVHGPAVMLFGGQAIGGAVNAIDKRIPRAVPKAITGAIVGGYATAADERSIGGAIDAPIGDRFVAHLDGSWRKSGNVRIGGYVNSPALRAELLGEAAEHAAHGEADEAAEFTGLAEQRGRIANSAARTTTLGAGLAFIDAGGNLGVSVQHTDSRYGVPMRPGAGHGHGHGHDHDHDHDHGEESEHDHDHDHGHTHHHDAPVTIGLKQTRIDVRGGLEIGGLFERLEIRGAYGDYRHIEFEGAEPGTRFAGEGVEYRVDLVQSKHGGWRGRSGVHGVSRSMTIAGPEAFTPDNRVDRLGAFTLQSLALGGGLELEAAGRFERVAVKATSVDFDRRFDLWSGALGASFAPSPDWKLGVNVIRGARAPSPEELLSDGMHMATQSYERGNRDFAIEKSTGFEGYIRYATRRAEFSLTGYHTRFARFITARPTGEAVDGLPVYQYAQTPARFSGFEAAAAVEALRWGGGSLRLDAAGDYTHARLVNIGPAPRIPPLRLRGGAELRQETLTLRGELEWNQRQNRVAAFENPTPAFTMVNLSADWHPMGADGPLTLLLAADNLLDVVGRRAASFTRDFAPLPGRDIRLTAKISF